MSARDISRIVFISRGSFESFMLCYPAHKINPTCDCVRMSIGYIEVNLVALPRISRGYFVGVILRVSQPGWCRTAQSLYALKLRATIIGYVPPLAVYGILNPLLGETYLRHSGSNLSYPWFVWLLAVVFLRCMLCAL